MKKKLLTLLLLSSSLMQLRAQDGNQKIIVPSSPAFSILDFEPSAVMKPTNGKDLATDVLSSFDKDGKLLMNLGLEVSPYWLQSRPTLTREKYLNPSLEQTFLQSLSISAATVKDSASGSNRLGTGFRFKVANGKPVDSLFYYQNLARSKKQITSLIAPLRGIPFVSMDSCLAAINSNLNNPIVSDEDRTWVDATAKQLSANYTAATTKAFIDTLVAVQVNSFSDLEANIQRLLYQRKGLIVEFAGATAFNTNNKTNLERVGIWGNVSNYISPTDLLVATARYMWHSKDTAYSNFDLGVSYLKQSEHYNISFEALIRWYAADIPDINQAGESILRSEKKFTYRIAATGSYIITKDISINISFGKNFDSPFLSGSSFFSILGVNYSIFKYPVIKE